jgi:hypothetical protein
VILESSKARELTTTLALILTPKTIYPHLIADTTLKTRETTNGPLLIATTRRTFTYHSTAFIKIKRLADEDRDRRKIRDILLGLHQSKINLGLTLNFNGEATILFHTTTNHHSQEHAEQETIRRTTILQHVLRSQLPKSEIQTLQNPHELPTQPQPIHKAHIYNDTATIETNHTNYYLGAVQIDEITGYSQSPTPLFEALVKINLPTTYQAYATPITTPLQNIITPQRPRFSPSPKFDRTRETVPKEPPYKPKKPSHLYKTNTTILLQSDQKETLDIALESIATVARTALSQKDNTIKATRAKGLNLLKTINQTRTYTPHRPHQVLTPDEITTTIQFPTIELPGITGKTQPKLTPPQKTKEPEVLELGEILRNGNPTGRPALLPTQTLPGHTLILGTTRSGKSNLVKNLLQQTLEKTELNFLVFDPHNEYNTLTTTQRPAKTIDPTKARIRINLLEPPLKVNNNPAELSQFLENVIATIRIIFGGDWGPVIDGLAHKSLYNLYTKTTNPTIADWIQEAQTTAKQGDQRTRAALDSLTARLTKMTTGIYGQLFNQPHTTLNTHQLLNTPTILNLSNLDEDAQRFLTAILLKQILDHRKKHGPTEETHITVLEEAHNFAPRIYRATSSADEMSRNQAQKFLAELAKFNQALILIDQRPSRITEDAIANCNTIITFHLQQKDDKNTVVAALGYSPYDPQGRQLSNYLTTLQTGHAIIKTPNAPYPYEIQTSPHPQPNTPNQNNIPDIPTSRETPPLTKEETQTLQTFQNNPIIKRNQIPDQNNLNQLLTTGLVDSILNGEAYQITRKGQRILQNHKPREEEGPT